MSISLNWVSYSYALGSAFEVKAIKELSLDIADGEYIGIMGETGSGKSTLVQLIAGLLTPSAGKILIDGEDINAKKYDRRKLRQKLGVVFQHPEHQLFETTAERDVSAALRRSGASQDEISACAREALESLGFDYDTIKDRSPFGFSDGEKRLIAIAGVIAAKPRLLILDEPLAGLDAAARESVLKLTDKLNKSGVTVLLISHDADALAEHAGRIIALKDGGLFRDGKTVKVFSEYEELSANGIEVPQARRAAHMLQLPKRTVTYKQLLAGLKTVCGGGGK